MTRYLLLTGLLSLSAWAGTASWYGSECAGRLMANGKVFKPEALTCAAWKWPLGTRLQVKSITNISTNSVTVTVTDRTDRRLGHNIDLSRAAFARLAELKWGVIVVEVKVIP